MGSCAFDKLFAKSVPHILEKIFLSLDYESYKECLKVSSAWNRLLVLESFQNIGRSMFQDEIAKDGRSLLQAAKDGNIEAVRRLLYSGMLHVNCGFGSYLETPLYRAAKHGQKDVVQLLLDLGAEPNKADILGWNPLYVAAQQGHGDVVQLLIDKGAEPNKACEGTTNGWTPLHRAAYTGNTHTVNVLLNGGAKPNVADKLQKTPLFLAAIYGHETVIQLLLDRGADPNVSNKNGYTPHLLARLQGYYPKYKSIYRFN